MSAISVVIVAATAVGFVTLVVMAMVGRHPDRQVSSSDRREPSEDYRMHGPPNDRPAGADADAGVVLPDDRPDVEDRSVT